MKKNIPFFTKVVSLLFLVICCFSSVKAQLTITEIMYNPPESGSDSLEFFEFVNTTSSTINLNNYSIVEGVSHTFTANDSILAGQYFVGAKDSAAFRIVFGFDADFIWTSGALSNGGEDITIKDDLGGLIDSVDFDNSFPWDPRANAGGPSLVLCDSLADNNDGANWYAAQTAIIGGIVNGLQIYANPGIGASCFKLSFSLDTAISCAGNNDGAVSISQTGGIAPISFLWSTGDTIFSVDTLSGGIYSVIGTDSNGLVDSISFSVSNPIIPTSTFVEEECDQYIWSQNGLTYTTSGMYYDTTTNTSGCDSIFILDLTINLATSSSDTVLACDGYMWLGNLLTATGTYMNTISNVENCDSILTLDLTIINSTTSFDTITSCDTYVWKNDTLNATGIYFDTIPNAANCDSVISLNLTILNSTSVVVLDTNVCVDFVWIQTGQTYNLTGIYNDTLSKSNGCDSIVSLDLTIQQSVELFFEDVCDTTFFVWRNDTLRASGTYIDTLMNQFACDSLIILELRIGTESAVFDTVMACSSYNFLGDTLTMSGVYVDTLVNAVGCDSVVNLNLTILSPSDTTILDTGCRTFAWQGQTLTISGTYIDTLINAVGCDSIISLILTMETTDTTVVQFDCYSYTWLQTGLTYDSTGLYVDTIPNAAGCDSIVTLDLTLQANDTTFNVLSCEGFYVWRGDVLINDGIYIDTVTNSFNCDSILILNLRISLPSVSFDTASSCNSYIWLNDTLNMSGTYIDTIFNSEGCDSVLTLELTILNATASTVIDTACDSYTWTVSGLTYSATGSYSFVDTNSVGCDSVITLDLLILNSTSSNESIDVCKSYTWPSSGLTYTETGVYSDTLSNSIGCDSLVFLNLTIRKADVSIIKRGFLLISQQNNATSYQWLDCLNGNTAITGATDQNFLVEENGEYAVAVAFDGCVDTSFCVEIVNVGIEEIKNELGFSLNPNPAKDFVMIDFVSNEFQTTKKLQILDITGSLIREYLITSKRQQFDISELNDGIYIIRYENSVKKLIVTR